VIRVDPDLLTVGIDASPRRIGWAVNIAGDIILADTWHVDKIRDIRDRREAWLHIRDAIRTAERVHHRDLHRIAIEDSYLGPNKKGSLDLARTIGHVEAWAIVSYPYVSLTRMPAATWRSLCGISGRGKDASLEYANQYRKQYGIVDDQDTADAICIAIAAARLDAEE
jgi:Holliday junction resolvasome RuvABC endonuclease subunit